ncbi:hypothetical protein SAPIO_CDS9225 [Scedosporium apiospermum]|uniref:Uncharacterized protein n=1 Tax=Pseudallescheria apiosperma TaxID=563466 RepID=A0A084FYL3_PSEDA|nr:uncharacterized protein SAPIO_CDS9225 [Scedosporium apiospermum]KEZ40175.1 hypothetical protein SAPIO_CDS9225 [Scedosporium apiospermum]
MVKPRQGKYLLEGVFSIDGDYHHVALNSNFRTSQLSPDYVLPKIDSPHMIVWKESEVMNDGRMLPRSATNDSLCLSENYSLRQPSFPLDSRFVDKHTHDGLHAHLRRQNGWFDPVDVIGSTDGCPSERLVAMIGVATDCTYTAEFESVNDARENIISQINVASQVYEDTFNIALAIRNLTISDASSTRPVHPMEGSIPGQQRRMDPVDRLQQWFNRWNSLDWQHLRFWVELLSQRQRSVHQRRRPNQC